MKDTLEVWWSSGYWGIHDPSVHVLQHHVPLWGLPGSLQLLKMDDVPFSDSIPVELHWFPADLALAAAQPPSRRVVYCCPQFLRLRSTSQFAEDGTSIKDILCPSVPSSLSHSLTFRLSSGYCWRGSHLFWKEDNSIIESFRLEKTTMIPKSNPTHPQHAHWPCPSVPHLHT